MCARISKIPSPSAGEFDLMERARRALDAAGLVNYEPLDTSGETACCGTTEKPNGTAGRYRLHLNFPPTLWASNWHTGYRGATPLYNDAELKAMPPRERKALAESIRQEKERSDAKMRERRAAAAAKAKATFEPLPHAGPGNPYLKDRGVKPLGDMRQKGAVLVVPYYQWRGGAEALATLQYLWVSNDPNEEPRPKRFLKDGEQKGAYFPIPARDKSDTGPLLICEGVATGLSLAQSTGHAVLVAGEAHNLEAVARMAASRWPGRAVVPCADNDKEREEGGRTVNTGLDAATKAAAAIQAPLAVCPKFEGREKSDFNDLFAHAGPEAVASIIRKALEEERDTWAPGFFMQAKGRHPGIYYQEPDNDEAKPLWICGPLEVLGLTRTKASDKWGLLLRWRDPDDVAHVWAMPRAALTSRDTSIVTSRLADGGLALSGGGKAPGLLCRFLAGYRTARRVRCVSATGWHDGRFVFPVPEDGETSGKREALVFQGFAPFDPYQTAGTLEGWQNGVAAPCVGNPLLLFALSASFAAALLDLAGLESGGFHLDGLSSGGKTTTLLAAASVWGSGARSGGFMRNWSATSNGLEGLAALHSDAPLILDEIGQATGAAIRQAAYLLGNGVGKARMRADGTAKEMLTWRTIILSSGETSLGEKIRQEGGQVQAGQEVRLLDLPLGATLFDDLHGHESSKAFAVALEAAAGADYGHAGRAFVRQVETRRDEALALVRSYLGGETFPLCRKEASGQVQRAARRFLLCAAAGVLAVQYGIVPWREADVLGAIEHCFTLWLEGRGGDGNAEDGKVLEQVRHFIEMHGQARFSRLDGKDKERVVINRAGYRDEDTFYFLPGTFKYEVVRGFNPRHALAVLADAGWLQKEGGRNQVLRRTPDLGPQRVHAIKIPIDM